MSEEKKTSRKVWGWEYVGSGAAMPGIPARHIPAGEAKQRGIDVASLDKSELFEKVYQAPKDGE